MEKNHSHNDNEPRSFQIGKYLQSTHAGLDVDINAIHQDLPAGFSHDATLQSTGTLTGVQVNHPLRAERNESDPNPGINIDFEPTHFDTSSNVRLSLADGLLSGPAGVTLNINNDFKFEGGQLSLAKDSTGPSRPSFVTNENYFCAIHASELITTIIKDYSTPIGWYTRELQVCKDCYDNYTRIPLAISQCHVKYPHGAYSTRDYDQFQSFYPDGITEKVIREGKFPHKTTSNDDTLPSDHNPRYSYSSFGGHAFAPFQYHDDWQGNNVICNGDLYFPGNVKTRTFQTSWGVSSRRDDFVTPTVWRLSRPLGNSYMMDHFTQVPRYDHAFGTIGRDYDEMTSPMKAYIDKLEIENRYTHDLIFEPKDRERPIHFTKGSSGYYTEYQNDVTYLATFCNKFSSWWNGSVGNSGPSGLYAGDCLTQILLASYAKDSHHNYITGVITPFINWSKDSKTYRLIGWPAMIDILGREGEVDDLEAWLNFANTDWYTSPSCLFHHESTHMPQFGPEFKDAGWRDIFTKNTSNQNVMFRFEWERTLYNQGYRWNTAKPKSNTHLDRFSINENQYNAMNNWKIATTDTHVAAPIHQIKKRNLFKSPKIDRNMLLRLLNFEFTPTDLKKFAEQTNLLPLLCPLGLLTTSTTRMTAEDRRHYAEIELPVFNGPSNLSFAAAKFLAWIAKVYSARFNKQEYPFLSRFFYTCSKLFTTSSSVDILIDSMRKLTPGWEYAEFSQATPILESTDITFLVNKFNLQFDYMTEGIHLPQDYLMSSGVREILFHYLFKGFDRLKLRTFIYSMTRFSERTDCEEHLWYTFFPKRDKLTTNAFCVNCFEYQLVDETADFQPLLVHHKSRYTETIFRAQHQDIHTHRLEVARRIVDYLAVTKHYNVAEWNPDLEFNDLATIITFLNLPKLERAIDHPTGIITPTISLTTGPAAIALEEVISMLEEQTVEL